MSDWADLHLLRPWWLLALLPAAALAWALLRRHGRQAAWRRYIAPEFLPFLLEAAGTRRRRWPLAGLLAAWALAVLALAGPVWEKIPQPVLLKQSALVVLWDLSPSMLAEDVKPSRLTRSRLKLIDLLKARREGQTALVAYSAEAYPVTPLTDDNQTIINLLPALAPTTLPSVGSNPEMAFEVATQLLRDAGAPDGTILYITDAIDADAFDFIADAATDSSYEVVIWGVGTAEGAPIPLPTGGFARDASGEMVVPKLNEAELARFAVRVGGQYLDMQKSDADIKTLLGLLEPPSTPTTARTDRTFDQWFEHGQWLTLLLLPVVALWFRRGVVFALLLLPLAQPTPAQASVRDWFLNSEQRIDQQVQNGDSAAASNFADPARYGAQLYQDGAYGAAAKAFAAAAALPDSALDPAELAYNRGTALTQAGDYQAAIEAFDSALAARADYPDASRNKAIAEQLLERQQQQQQEQQKQEQQQQQQNPQDQQGQQDSSEQAQQDGEQQGQQGQAGGEPGEAEQDGAEQQPGDADNGETEPGSETAATESQPEEQNPYSGQQASATESEQPGDPNADPVGAQIAEGAQTEEEQMLEQLLRKIPDDPSGLLRNKFKYQYLQRRQQLPGATSPRDKQAEQRW